MISSTPLIINCTPMQTSRKPISREMASMPPLPTRRIIAPELRRQAHRITPNSKKMYAVGRRLSARNIRPLMTFGTVCFVIGLVGFMFSGASLWAWGISAAIFTLGEVIYAPGEYMLIDHIAPPGMKASYFSAQSLGWLGAAFNPMLTGLILTHLPHWSLFVILIVAIVAAWLMIFRGINARPWQPDSPLANA